jgi:hypothetical protein
LAHGISSDGSPRIMVKGDAIPGALWCDWCPDQATSERLPARPTKMFFLKTGTRIVWIMTIRARLASPVVVPGGCTARDWFRVRENI